MLANLELSLHLMCACVTIWFTIYSISALILADDHDNERIFRDVTFVVVSTAVLGGYLLLTQELIGVYLLIPAFIIVLLQIFQYAFDSIIALAPNIEPELGEEIDG